jgi:hypothetical protein|tara:strand:+ start:1055 stop:2218 length:1164 start_codon:yes stop_codon:yes gene_type:complete
MDKLETQMEQALQDAGFTITDTMPGSPEDAPVQEMQQAPVQEPVQTQAPEQSAPVAPATESEPQQVVESAQPVQQAAPVEDQPVTQEVIEPINQPEQGSLNNENEGFETFFNALMGETPPAQGETTASQSISPELDLDPRIQVIADFVDKTGRSPEDWFRYQALDPSEMDDRTVMRVQMASEYPSLGNDEIDLLISSKYRTDDNVYSEEEVKIANLQLKIDSEKARQSVGSLREAYTLPSQEASNVAQPDSPFDTDWFRSNAQSLTELSEIAFELPGDREFNYGVKADYRNELAKDNGNMTEFFDKYVDPKGEWDHDLWNMHRTVTDNLPNIIQSIYSQGLSDGQRNIVEKAANIDASGPQANPDQSQNDFITEQVLDALGRHQTFL